MRIVEPSDYRWLAGWLAETNLSYPNRTEPTLTYPNPWTPVDCVSVWLVASGCVVGLWTNERPSPRHFTGPRWCWLGKLSRGMGGGSPGPS